MCEDHGGDVGIVDPPVHDTDSGIVDGYDGVWALGRDIGYQCVSVVIAETRAVDTFRGESVNED